MAISFAIQNLNFEQDWYIASSVVVFFVGLSFFWVAWKIGQYAWAPICAFGLLDGGPHMVQLRSARRHLFIAKIPRNFLRNELPEIELALRGEGGVSMRKVECRRLDFGFVPVLYFTEIQSERFDFDIEVTTKGELTKSAQYWLLSGASRTGSWRDN